MGDTITPITVDVKNLTIVPDEKKVHEESKKILADLEKRAIARTALAQHGQHLADLKIGRNEKCPCGTGKKWKYCCMNEVKGYL